jgi:DNA-binding NarL/FixJ family response regulator
MGEARGSGSGAEELGMVSSAMTVDSAAALAPDTGTPRVLVVDSNRRVRTALVELLRLLGMRVVEAAELDGARQAVRDLHPTVAVVDWRLRDRAHAGIHAARALLEADPSLRVIVYTGEHDAELQPQILAAGVFAYLPKGGVGKADLLDAIRTAHTQRAASTRP